MELYTHVVGSVSLYVSDELKDEVLCGNAGLEFSCYYDFHALGDLEPYLACRPCCCHLGTADTGRECTVCSVCTGMAVASHHDKSGEGKTFLAHLLVADSAVAGDIVEMLDALFCRELTDFLVVHRVIAGGCRDRVVKDEYYALGLPYVFNANFLECSCDRSPVVVAHAPVRLDCYDLVGYDIIARRSAKCLFGKCLAHLTFTLPV